MSEDGNYLIRANKNHTTYIKSRFAGKYCRRNLYGYCFFATLLLKPFQENINIHAGREIITRHSSNDFDWTMELTAEKYDNEFNLL